MSLRQLGAVVLGCGVFSVMLGSAGRPESDSGMTQFRLLARGIHLYAQDADGTYPLSMVLEAGPGAGQWSSSRRIAAPPGLMRDTTPALKAAYAAAWVNSVAPYWPNADVLVIAGAPTAPPFLKLEDTLTTPLRVGVTYNGYLHRLSQSVVPHPELVPLIWTGLGKANAEGFATASPNLNCQMLLQPECIFNPKPNGFATSRTMMFMALGSAAAFDGAMVFGMADGSAKRVQPHLKTEPFKSEDDPWGSYTQDGRPMTYFNDEHGYVAHFRPDRQPKK